MKKRNILITVFAAIITAVSAARAERINVDFNKGAFRAE